MEREDLNRMLEEGMSLEAIGRRVGLHPSTVGYWVRKHGLEAVNRDRHAARGGLDREVVERLVREGRSTTEIASATGVSKTTVRHWLRKWGLRTNAGVRRAAGASAHAAAALNPRLPCLVHGLSEFVLEAGGGYRCRRCRTEQVSKHRRKAKATLVAEAGGCCQICGYRTYLGALQFHHIDPSTKRLEVNARGAAVALDTLRAEARKCALLCSNCHAEVEGGVATL